MAVPTRAQLAKQQGKTDKKQFKTYEPHSDEDHKKRIAELLKIKENMK